MGMNINIPSAAEKDWTSTSGVITSFDTADWVDANTVGADQALTSIAKDSDNFLVFDVPVSTTAASNVVGAIYNTATTNANQVLGCARIAVLHKGVDLSSTTNAQTFVGLCWVPGNPADVDAGRYFASGFETDTNFIGMDIQAYQGISAGDMWDSETAPSNGAQTGVWCNYYDVCLVKTGGSTITSYYSVYGDGHSWVQLADSTHADFNDDGFTGFRMRRNTGYSDYKVKILAFAPAGVLSDVPGF
jgi:hypothetical protein